MGFTNPFQPSRQRAGTLEGFVSGSKGPGKVPELQILASIMPPTFRVTVCQVQPTWPQSPPGALNADSQDSTVTCGSYKSGDFRAS